MDTRQDLADEAGRLAALRSYRVLETDPERCFDTIADLARTTFEVPIALVSFVDEHRLWFKAHLGIDLTQMPRATGFCTHAIAGEGALVVPDLRADPRFASNPLVAGGLGLRFYAGAPLVMPGGHRLGTLCILDTIPRQTFSPRDLAILMGLAALVVERLEARRAEFANHTVRGFADTTSTAVLCIDGDGRMTFANRAALHLFDYAPSEIIGRKLDQLMPERFRDAHAAGVSRIAHGGTPKLAGKTVEIVALRRDGREFPAELAICSWREAGVLSTGATIRDVSERKERDHRLQRLAHQDTLTGLANRASVDAALSETYTDGTAVALLLIDLDGFKQVNDILGHAAGDALLQSVALRFRTAIDGDALLARFGGDEFAVVSKRHGDPLLTKACAENLLAALEPPFQLLGHELQVGASIGGAVGPGQGRYAEELVAAADLALYRAKAEGRNRFRLFEPAMRSALAAKLTLQDEIRLAVDRNELTLFFQPQVDLLTGRVTGAETLLRWRHPERGLLAPGAFIATLETHTLAAEVGTWILQEACRQVVTWREAGLPRLRISLNLFAVQLRDRHFAARVAEALDRHGLAPAELELEIVETIALQDNERVLGPLRELRRLGVGLAFDDFGTGYASLSTLKRVPLTTLKIDRSFVRDINDDAGDAAVVEAVIGLGRRLGLDVIAEGVETAEQEATLLAMRCPSAQGYFYGRPMPAAAFAHHLGGTLQGPALRSTA